MIRYDGPEMRLLRRGAEAASPGSPPPGRRDATSYRVNGLGSKQTITESGSLMDSELELSVNLASFTLFPSRPSLVENSPTTTAFGLSIVQHFSCKDVAKRIWYNE